MPVRATFYLGLADSAKTLKENRFFLSQQQSIAIGAQLVTGPPVHLPSLCWDSVCLELSQVMCILSHLSLVYTYQWPGCDPKPLCPCGPLPPLALKIFLPAPFSGNHLR